ncbi:MAG: methyltransferase domain-containing protein [bacterium]|nr:methyltransferase domain-containing protein [bacterium]
MATITGGNTLIDPQIIIKKANLRASMRVADLGCGSSGHFVFAIAPFVGKEGVIYGVDILKSSLAHIRHRAQHENLRQVKTVWSNIEIFKATDIETASLDVALLINVLYQSSKRVDMIREAIRLTKVGGKIVIIDWNNIATPFGPSIQERVNKENLLKVADRLRLNLVEEFKAGQYHFGIIFQKL